MTRRFVSTLQKAFGKAFVLVPFDPNEAWGAKDAHHVCGKVGGCVVRGVVERLGDAWVVPIGAAWLRDQSVAVGDSVEIELEPEGPNSGNMGDDVAQALAPEPEARRFFDSLPTFYRNNYARWLKDAKRPETRAKRLAEMVALLKEGKRER